MVSVLQMLQVFLVTVIYMFSKKYKKIIYI